LSWVVQLSWFPTLSPSSSPHCCWRSSVLSCRSSVLSCRSDTVDQISIKDFVEHVNFAECLDNCHTFPRNCAVIFLKLFFSVLILVPWRINRYFFGPMDDARLDRIRHVGRSLGALLCCGATGMLDYLGSGPDDDSPPDFFDPCSLPPFCVEQMKRKW
jgi:hypothetical protein